MSCEGRFHATQMHRYEMNIGQGSMLACIPIHYLFVAILFAINQKPTPLPPLFSIDFVVSFPDST